MNQFYKFELDLNSTYHLYIINSWYTYELKELAGSIVFHIDFEQLRFA